MRAFPAFLLCIGLLSGSARADAVPAGMDGIGWLSRMAVAAQKYSYSGVFVYQNGENSESSRVVHVVDANGERERLESLDGSPREVVRERGEVKCYLPAQRMILLERERLHKSFPVSLPGSVGSISESYVVRKGELARVAGQESQQIILEPRDRFRYGHLLWADVNSGLLLKSRMVDARQAVLEQFSFSQVQIGGVVDPAGLKSRLAVDSREWRVHDARGAEEVADIRGWQFRNPIPGFKRTAGMKRALSADSGDVLHLVFSDGMAAMSVFIEPLSKEKVDTGLFSAGATNIYKRILGDRLITVVGEVPPQTLKRLGDGVEKK